MEIKKEINYKIDWHDVCTDMQTEAEAQKIISDRKHYFNMLRRMLKELDECNLALVQMIFEKYNVYFIDIDDIERVNIDEPKKGEIWKSL